MTEERFWDLVTQELTGEASEEERLELENALAADASLRIRYAAMRALWRSGAPTPADKKQSAFDRHLQRLSNQNTESGLQYETPVMAIPENRRSRRIIRAFAWVAAAAAVVAAAWMFVFNGQADGGRFGNTAQNTVSTKRGSKSKIQLPDGTHVWLNADSRISYNENFQGSIREVTLSGEAFFDVARDESRPFVIHTSVIDVKVLGTSFNVRSYADEENTETSLIHGSVEITLRNSPEKKFTLKPNDKLIVSNEEAGVEGVKDQQKNKKRVLLTWGKIRFKETDTTAVETMWVKNKLVFDEESLESIATKLERWYDIKVTLTDESLNRTNYSGIFIDETVEEVIEALQITGKFRYTLNKKELTIRP